MNVLEKLIQQFVRSRNWAIVGASNDTSKYGNVIFNVMKGSGYNVYGINPKGGELYGQKLYPSLTSLQKEKKIDDLIVDFVVPPETTEKVLKECKELGLKKVWLQPGSESKAAIQYGSENGIDVVHNACCMTRRINWNK